MKFILEVTITLASIFSFFLGLIVIVRQRTKQNIAFAVFAFLTSLWTLANVVNLIYPSLTAIRLTYASGALVMAASLGLVVYFAKYNEKIAYFSYGLGITNFFASMSPLIIKRVIAFNTTGDIFETGLLFNYYSLCLIITLTLDIVFLFKALKNPELNKNQTKFLLLGILLFGIFALFFDTFLPMFNIQYLANLDSPAALFFGGFAAYAIVKHRLMDIRVLAFRSVTYSLTVGLIVAAYVSVAYFITERYQDINIVNVFTLITLLAMYNPLRRFIEKYTDKLFFKGQYNFQELVSRINDIIAHNSRSASELTNQLTDVFLSEIKASEANFFMPDNSFKWNKADTLVKDKTGAVVLDEMEEGSKEKEILKSLLAEVLLGIKTEEKTEAILFLGEKKSGEMYSAEDLRLLELVAPQIAIALENARLYEQAITDGLTGLYHHRYFHIRLTEELLRAQRYNLPFSLIMMDLDYFKQINDEHGHQVGDKVLVELSKLIKENVRACDIVGRYGGDEFVILLPAIGKNTAKKYKAEADRVIKRLRSKIEEYSFTNLHLKLKASFGIVIYNGKFITAADELIKKADKLLYKAKESGRNTLCIEELKSEGQKVA